MKKLYLFATKHSPNIDERFHQLNLDNIGNVVYWYNFFKIIRNVKGDVVECGVGRGRSLAIISALNYIFDAEEGGKRLIYGYDSFEGFPEPTMEDSSYRNPKKGEWSFSPSGKYKYTPAFIKNIIKNSHIPTKNLIIIKGFFEKTLIKNPCQSIAMLHIDCDLYQSYKTVLKLLYKKVSRGGLVVFDDIIADRKNSAFPGALKAVKEFFGKDFIKMKISIAGKYFFQKS